MFFKIVDYVIIYQNKEKELNIFCENAQFWLFKRTQVGYTSYTSYLVGIVKYQCHSDSENLEVLKAQV